MTAESRARHWAQIDEVTFTTGIRFLFLVFRVFGHRLFRVCVYPAVVFYVITNPRARAASRGYLARVSRAMGRPESELGVGLMLRHFGAFAECMLDKVRIWNDPRDPMHIEWHNRDVVAGPLAEGRGGLIFTSHLGNVEVCRGLSKIRPGLKLTVLVHTKHARAFNRLLAEINPASSLNLWQVSDISPETAIRISERVAQGELIVIAADRVPVSANPRVAYADFLGDQAAFPVGPYVLASLLQCPSYLLFCLRQDDGYHVYYESFRDMIKLPRRGRDAALAELAGAYAERLASYCKLAPLQWFNFYDFWSQPQAARIDASR